MEAEVVFLRDQGEDTPAGCQTPSSRRTFSPSVQMESNNRMHIQNKTDINETDPHRHHYMMSSWAHTMLYIMCYKIITVGQIRAIIHRESQNQS